MSTVIAWIMFALGVAHVVFGLIRSKTPLREAASAGLIGQFSAPEIRRTAFWFLFCGPLLMLAGLVAIHGVATGAVGCGQVA
jgi:hypothetical protein